MVHVKKNAQAVAFAAASIVTNHCRPRFMTNASRVCLEVHTPDMAIKPAPTDDA